MTPVLQYQSDARPAKAIGKPRLKYPLIGSSPIQLAAYAFEQDFEAFLPSFPPAPKNTSSFTAAFGVAKFTPPSSSQDTSNAILTGYSQPVHTGGGAGKFMGSFAIVPASWDDYQTQIVNFPAWLNYVYGTNYRDAKPTEVTVRLHYDYYVMDPNGIASAILDSGGTPIKTVSSKGLIPLLRRTPWLATYGGVANVNQEAKTLVPAGGIAGEGASFYLPTLPTLGQYQAWCAVATAFLAANPLVAWTDGALNTNVGATPPVWNGSSTTDILSGQYRFANSKLVDYAGNIVARITAYAMAE
jgi:hypothetical protein